MRDSKSSGLLRIYKRLFAFVKPYKYVLVLFILVSFISIFSKVYEGYLLQNIVNLVVKKQLSKLTTYIAASLFIIVVGIFVSYLLQYLYGKFSSNFMKDCRDSIYGHFQKLSLQVLESRHTGDLVSRFTNDLSSLQNFFGQDIITLFLEILLFIASFTYLAIINWKLLLLSIALSPVSIFAVIYLSKFVKLYSRENQEFLGKANVVVQDAIGGIPMIKSYGLKNWISKRYEEEIYNHGKATRKITMASICTMPIHVVLRMVPNIICISYGGYLALQGHLTPGELTAFIYLLGYVSMPLALLPQRMQTLKAAEGAVERVMEVFDWPLEHENGDLVRNTNSEIAIELKNVTFRYNEEANVINELYLLVEKGKKIAIVGQSGCGKSTLLKLICGFYTPSVGEVCINRQNIEESNLTEIRSLISLVTQDTYLFPVSIMENISYGHVGASFDDIVNAAKIANAYEFIMDLPKGFQTQVGERGIKLSGGQRQRLSLARAILKNAPILLLDEPTSALDTASEALIQEDLEKICSGKTVVIVAHRFFTIKKADKIIVLNNGTIVESGTHDELLSLSGSYSQLYKKQFINDRTGLDND